MAVKLNVSAFNSLPTIVFKNKALNNGLTVWVCADKAACGEALLKLKPDPNIEVLEISDSHVYLGES